MVEIYLDDFFTLYKRLTVVKLVFQKWGSLERNASQWQFNHGKCMASLCSLFFGSQLSPTHNRSKNPMEALYHRQICGLLCPCPSPISQAMKIDLMARTTP